MARSTPDRARALRRWQASYDPALKVARGERLTPGKTDPDNPGWQWATNAAGLGGWLPEGLVREGRASRAFDSTELTVEPGEILTVTERLNAWSRCVGANGATGWLPDTHLGPAGR